MPIKYGNGFVMGTSEEIAAEYRKTLAGTWPLSADRKLEQGGTKHDSGKPDLSLVPRVLQEEVAKALGFGEKKYGRYNYLKGFESHRLVAACLRHVVAFQDGEDLDPESGQHHLAHAAACIAMLLDCKAKGTLTDTRFKK